MNNPPNEDQKIEFGEEFSRKLTIHKNLTQEVIITTVDKLRLRLIENQESLKSRKEWLTPLGILVALIATLVATDFKSSLGLKADVWEAIFILSSIICAIWLIKLIIFAWQNRKKSTIDYIVNQLKIETKKHSENIEEP